MCDFPSTLKSSLLFWTLSLIPTNILGYIALSIVPVLLMVYIVHSNRPSAKLSRLNDAVAMTDDILTRAKARCMRDHLLLAESETRLLRYYFLPLLA
jgi:hypothetical protein